MKELQKGEVRVYPHQIREHVPQKYLSQITKKQEESILEALLEQNKHLEKIIKLLEGSLGTS